VALQLSWIVTEREGCLVRFPTSKTNQKGLDPDEIFLPRESGITTCPVAALEAWLKMSGITAGPIFRPVYLDFDGLEHLGKRAICTETVANIVKRHVAAAGENPSVYAGHSLRRGFMTSGALADLTTTELMRQSRHKSERVAQGYVDQAMLIRKSPARGLLRKIADRAGIDIETPMTLLDSMGDVVERSESEQRLTRVKRRRK
jgi:hypothetical protein